MLAIRLLALLTINLLDLRLALLSDHQSLFLHAI